MCELENIFHLKYTLMAIKIHLTGREWAFLTISRHPLFFDQFLDNQLLKAPNYFLKRLSIHFFSPRVKTYNVIKFKKWLRWRKAV